MTPVDSLCVDIITEWLDEVTHVWARRSRRRVALVLVQSTIDDEARRLGSHRPSTTKRVAARERESVGGFGERYPFAHQGRLAIYKEQVMGFALIERSSP